MDAEARKSSLALLRLAAPLLKGRAFAAFDAYRGAVWHGGFYDGFSRLEFAAVRDEYERLLPELRALADENGLVLDCEADGIPKPYARIGGGAGGPWIHIHPADRIPAQSLLRLRLLGEARRSVAACEAAADGGSGLRRALKAALRLRRYNGMRIPPGGAGGYLDEPAYAILSSVRSRGILGERALFEECMPESYIFPLRDGSFEGVDVSLPRRMLCWGVEDDARGDEIMGLVHREALDCLEEIDRVAAALGTGYFLVSGTLLGAWRGRGFIPWDEDSDIGMLRHDYRRFVRHAEGLLGEGYSLSTRRSDPDSHFVYARFYKNDVRYVTQYNENKDIMDGVWVDIFPFDAQPRGRALRGAQARAANLLARVAMSLKRWQEYARCDRPPSPGEVPGCDARWYRLCRAAARFFPHGLFRALYGAACTCFGTARGDGGRGDYACFYQDYTTMARDELLPLGRMPFEDAMLSVPHDPLANLNQLYGDDLEPPPPHLRQGAHGFLYLELPDGRRLQR